MKKIYENMELNVVFFNNDDIVMTSQNYNLGTMPDFPENFTGNN